MSATRWVAVLSLATFIFLIATPAGAVPGEVPDLQWCSGPKTCLKWTAVPTATQYRVYRGERASLPCLLNPTTESCDDGTYTNTTTFGTIIGTPSAGSFFWFVVTASDGSSEGTPGVATSGPRFQNAGGTCLPTCGAAATSCSVDADCCSGSCIAGTCQALCCQPTTAFCTVNSDCCSGSCSGGQCLNLCTMASECPGPDTDCQQRTCTVGTCGFSYTPSGTATGSQTAGDCQTQVCDGNGGFTTVANNNDLPDDGNQCTNDLCLVGVPNHQPAPLNTPCSQNGGSVCNSNGACVQCNSSSQCPGTDTECRQRTCSASTCGLTFTPFGTPTSSQNPGDCHVNQCDGSGNIVNVVDNGDVPADDGNQCTNETCVAGSPMHPPRPINSPCSQNGGSFCGASGTCVQCNSASQCPGTDTECRQRTCSASTCGITFTSFGTPTSSQNPGDCHVNQCDGSGNIVNVIDNTDVPVDGNQCTDDVCSAGVPMNPSSPAGTSCSQGGGNVCNGSGSCVVGPQVTGTIPPDGTLAAAGISIDVTFSQAMNPATLSAQTSAGACSGSIQVSLDNFSSCVAFASASPTMSGGNTNATLVPQPGFLVNRTFKIRVTTAAVAASGAPLAPTFTQGTGFTTRCPNLCAGSLVISQVYGAGGTTGAAWRNDFVELHNRGPEIRTVTGMSIQYASATGNTWLVTNLPPGTIPPGGYYLVQLFSSGSIGTVLPTPDATGSTDMAIANGKIALVLDTTTLTGTCPSGGAILDFVGYGGTANCNEGGANAPSPSATNAILRVQNGCGDVDLNVADFAQGAASPRNTLSSALICNCVAQNESNVAAEADYCVVNFPSTLSVQTGVSTGSIFGQVFEAGVTEPAGAAATVRAQVGYGPPTANPQFEPGWTWVNSSYNFQVGNNDEYQGSFIAPAVGSYRYVYRFSLDAGTSWTYCDGNAGDGGAGSNAGLTFDLENEPVLTVTP